LHNTSYIGLESYARLLEFEPQQVQSDWALTLCPILEVTFKLYIVQSINKAWEATVELYYISDANINESN